MLLIAASAGVILWHLYRQESALRESMALQGSALPSDPLDHSGGGSVARSRAALGWAFAATAGIFGAGLLGLAFAIRRLGCTSESLRQSQERLRAIIDNALDAVVTMDSAGLITDWNPKSEAVFGWTRKEAIGRPMSETIIPHRYREAHIRGVKHFLASGEGPVLNQRIEITALHRDGHEFPIELSVTPLKFGEAFAFSAFIRDITAHKQAQAELKTAHEELRFAERKYAEEQLQRVRNEHAVILDSMSEGVHWIDPDGRIHLENPAAERMLGYKAGELIGKPAHPTMHHTRADGTPYPVCNCHIYATLRDGVVRRVEDEVFWRKDGTSFPVDYTCAPIRGANGAIIGTVVVFTDITARKKAESEMHSMQTQLLETSRQAGMSEVAANVLHNVGNVLNSVNTSCSVIANKVRKSRIDVVAKTAEMLHHHTGDLARFFASDPAGQKLPDFLDKFAGRLSEEQAEVLKEIQRLSQNIEHIKDIIAVQQSCARCGGVRETLPLQEMVEDALRMNSEALSRYGVAIVREYEEAPPVAMEKHKVLQILVNLVSNAKYALTESARPDKQICLRIARHDGHVAVSVSDNGIGIAPENLARIFAHGFTTRKEGHGFGLHSGVLAAQEMGGRLMVHSDGPGRGATFTLELPLSSASENCDNQPQLPPLP